ncbi:multidrug transporter [Allofrancisella inopinata]|uniref:Multidrug transporter n=1 Tax=Allofrancisella inopinata TaxID=1085647 RepID=A0AAE6YID2_9GAMM|nr:polysaccharide biosynthesis C-terminal domain-containing protein [Allofrancisella inopinata]QIV96308.1 multidrug transporter [Allofrancisella inopinata]
MLKRIFSNHILSKSLLTMFVQALGQGCAFITAILLARHLNINEYGYYIFGVTVATILAVIATMGAGGILARTWGKSDLFDYQRDKETFLVQNWYFKRGISIILTTLLLIFSYSHFKGSINYIEIFALLFAIPFFVANILQSFFVAKRIVVLANLLQLGLRLIMLFITIFFIVWYVSGTVTLVASMVTVMLIYITLIWLRQLKKYSFKSSKPSGSNLSFALMQWGLLLLSQIDILILKGISDTKSIALYGVALQLSALVSFVLNAVNSNVLSQIADDYKNCSLLEFQKRVTSYTKIIFFLSIFAIIGLLVCGYPITLLYGEQYTVSYYIFSILMVGQIINVLSGCVATILNMAGYEKKTCIAFYIALLINIVLGIIFTEIWGVYGLAVASSLSMTYWNIHLLYQVVTKLKINPTIFIKI